MENRYKPSNQIRYKTSMLRLDLCDYSDAYIVVTRNITVTNENYNDGYNRKLASKKMYHLLLAFQRLMES